MPPKKYESEKMEKLCTHWPTGISILDIMFGENFRDLNGDLTNVIRGFEMTGKQYAIAGQQGAGKSTLVTAASAFPIHIGMADCIWKIIYVDTDNGSMNDNRLRNLTDLHIDVIKEKYHIIRSQSIEEITDELKALSAEYQKSKVGSKKVKFFDPYLGIEREMYPSVLMIFDTVTSISSNNYEEKEILAKQQGLTTFLDIANLSNNIGNLFNKNNATIWLSHLKENVPKIGQTVADKEFKSAPAKLKSHIPKRIAQKLSGYLWLTKIQDMENQESNSHPIQIYGLQDLKTKTAYYANGITVKSRTGSEGRTVAKVFLIDSKVDPTMTMLATALDLKILKESSGMYPSADNPLIFKGKEGCEAEVEAHGMRRKTALTIKGYDRTTNIIEARLLLNYTGDNEEIIDARNQLMSALQEEMEEKLYYELETNNVTGEKLESNQNKIKSLLGFIRSTNRKPKNVTRDELEERTPEDKLEEHGAKKGSV